LSEGDTAGHPMAAVCNLSLGENPFIDEHLFYEIKKTSKGAPFDKIRAPQHALDRAHKQFLNYRVDANSDPLQVASIYDSPSAADLVLQATFLWIPLSNCVRQQHDQDHNLQSYSHLPQVRRNQEGINQCTICPLVTKLSKVTFRTKPFGDSGYVKTREHCISPFHVQSILFFNRSVKVRRANPHTRSGAKQSLEPRS
jgi:hypothetical protein